MSNPMDELVRPENKENLSLDQIMEYDPSNFAVCRIISNGCDRRFEHLLDPAIAVVLSDIGKYEEGREVTGAEKKILMQCPAHLLNYISREDRIATASEDAKNARYDLFIEHN